MALIPCYECGKSISDQAKSCIQCGAPQPRPINQQKDLGWNHVENSKKLIESTAKNSSRDRWVVVCIGIFIVFVLLPYLHRVINENSATQSFEPNVTIPSENNSSLDSQSTQQEVTIPVYTDSKATYKLLELDLSKKKPIITTKRVGPSGTSYSKREVDCANRKFRYLADSEILEDMKNSKRNENFAAIVPNSISAIISEYACLQAASNKSK